MGIDTKKIKEIDLVIDRLIQKLKDAEKQNKNEIRKVCKAYSRSARNLVHYRALRTMDLTPLQKALGELGMSRLARAETSVMASLLNTKLILSRLAGEDYQKPKSGLSIKNGTRLLSDHTAAVLGKVQNNRRVRIMVTMPSEAADRYDLVHEMVAAGMNCARINCAHDGPNEWKRMIDHIRKASESLARDVRIAMDLAGPKIRTGEILAGPHVKKFSPKRDVFGKVVEPASIILVSVDSGLSIPDSIPVPAGSIQTLSIGDELLLKDLRGKKRKLTVVYKGDLTVTLSCNQTIYLSNESILGTSGKNKVIIPMTALPALEQLIMLGEGDFLWIHRDDIKGGPAVLDQEGKKVKDAHISCSLPELIESVSIDDPIFFDDGKIGGVVIETHKQHFKIRITQTGFKGAKLRAEKGINLPATDIGINGMTAKDIEDLKFIAQHADVVNCSFVNSKEDVEQIISECEKLGVRDSLNLILKIETKRAFDNLTEILLAAMQVHYIGVMIARGDLAVEVGWRDIGLVQKEMIKLTTAAHVPVVWATQVLEGLAKKGLPSRAEMTDATSSLKAECVMLNKGPYINKAIKLLDEMLVDMEPFQEKNYAMLPKMGK